MERKMKAQASVTQSCLTLCNPIGCSPAGSSVHGVSQARMLEWVATAPWTAARQAPLSMGFPRQECWSGYHSLPRGLPDPGAEPGPRAAGRLSLSEPQWLLLNSCECP